MDVDGCVIHLLDAPSPGACTARKPGQGVSCSLCAVGQPGSRMLWAVIFSLGYRVVRLGLQFFTVVARGDRVNEVEILVL